MGYVHTVKAAYFGSQARPVQLGYYTNDTGYAVTIKSIQCYAGIGKANTAYTWGDYVVGTGAPIEYYVQCAGVNSNTVTLTNQVSALLGNGGYYPNRKDTVSVTVSFDNVVVQNGGTVYFTLPWLVGYTSNAFILNNRIDATVSVAEYDPITYYTVSYDANGGSGAPSSQTKASNANLTLTTAKPSGNKQLTLTFDANGGSVSPSSKQYSAQFVCWNTKADGTGTNYNPGGTFTTNANTTFYAKWGTASVSGLPTPSRSSYKFKGWFTSSNTQIQENSTISSNTTVYARWQRTYVVSYNANGGSGAPSSQIKNQGESLVLTANKPTTSKTITVTFNPNGGSVSTPSSTKTCSFLRWNTKADGSGTNYNPGGTYTADSAATMYAMWSSEPVGQLPTPTRNNCSFSAWYTQINGGTLVTQTTSFSNNTTIYARWDYIVQYDLNGGTLGDDSSSQIPYAVKRHQINLSLTTLKPTKQGKEFVGWSADKNATQATYASGGTYATDAPVTLYAIYKVRQYTVTFDLKGGTYQGGGALVQTVSAGNNATLPNDPTHEARIFKGWIGSPTNIQKDTTIYALWNGCPIWVKRSDGKWRSYIV